MNPAIFVGVITALLAASRAGKGDDNKDPTPTTPLAILLWFVIGPIWLFALGSLIAALGERRYDQLLPIILTFVVTTLVLYPWPIARRWLIPRGWAKLACKLTSLSTWVWRGDIRGGASIAAAWASIHRAQRLGTHALDCDWLEARLHASRGGASRWGLGGAGIIAAGLLAEAKGDRAQARRLLASAAELAGSTWPPHAMVIAWEWLCAEAASRGAWREVEFLARTAPIESRNLAWYGNVAARLTGIAPVPNDVVLQGRWLVTRNRVANWSLLRRATAAPAEPRKVDERSAELEPPPLPEGEPLIVAMRLHAELLARAPSKLSRVDIARLAHAWDLALADAALERRLDERGELLGAHASARSGLALSDSVREDLLMLIQAAGLEPGALADESEILGRASKLLHAELIDALEVSTGALEGRVSAKREQPALQEWQTFLALREQYSEAAALGGLALRRMAFATVHGPICSLAVWLWNVRGEKAIANAMFSWLLSEAIVVDDAEAIRLQEKNVRCGV